MPGDDSSSDSGNPKTNNSEQKVDSDESVSSALGGIHGPALRVVVPGKPDLQVWLQGVPIPLLRAVENLTKPSSIWKYIMKDVLPSLTPVATVFISIVFSLYACEQKERATSAADVQRMRADEVARKASLAAGRKALAELIDKFGQKAAVPDPKNSAQSVELEVAAMRFAAYGEDALPAVRMALGARHDGLRNGGVLVAEQMYRTETVERKRLTSEILGYYRAGDPVLRLGGLEWLAKLKYQLTDEDRMLALQMLRQSFGPRAEECMQQDEEVALETSKFLYIWSSVDSKDLVAGLVETCADPKFDNARFQALDALLQIASKLKKPDRESIVGQLDNPRIKAGMSEDLLAKLDKTLTKIRKIA